MPVKVNKEKADAVLKEKLAELSEKVSAERIKRLDRGFEHNGKTYPMNVEAQVMFVGLSMAIVAGKEHANIIKPKGKKYETYTDEELLDIGVDCLFSAGAVNIPAWDANDLIGKASTLEEAEAIFQSYMESE